MPLNANPRSRWRRWQCSPLHTAAPARVKSGDLRSAVIVVCALQPVPGTVATPRRRAVR